MELTPEDTIKDLQNLLIDAIPGFEFPKKDLMNYEISIEIITEDELVQDDFVVGTKWGDILEDGTQVPRVVVDRSHFSSELTSEEVNILALLMKQGWVQRQVTSIENTRMKFSSQDFKMTSQANHLAKLLTLLDETRRDSFHMQRLYGRRKLDEGMYKSTWSALGDSSVSN